MNIIVCVKRVPDLAEVDVEIGKDGRSLAVEDLDFSVNEWDLCALETALQIADAEDGKVTVLTIGEDEAEDVLRRALAMGAHEALHLMDVAFSGADARGLARILAQAIAGRPHDLVLTGAVSADEGRGQVGGLLAARLGVPFVALATDLAVDSGHAQVQHEVEGGQQRVTRVPLPAVVSVQTGIREPRYVSIRGIRKVAGVDIAVLGAAELDLATSEVGAAAARVQREALFLPPRGDGAEILEGDDQTVVAELVERLHRAGVL